MSEKAPSRNEYKRTWNRNNPDKVKAAKRAYWERKARTFYGSRYLPPEDPEQLSIQARALYNEYYRARRIANPDENKTNVANYWKRKASANP